MTYPYQFVTKFLQYSASFTVHSLYSGAKYSVIAETYGAGTGSRILQTFLTITKIYIYIYIYIYISTCNYSTSGSDKATTEVISNSKFTV